jgi:RNA polymerase sigma factor (sigma-70 family)
MRATTYGEERDGALVAAALAGDKTALATLLGRHYPGVARLCQRMLRERPLAEDATQEAVLLAMLNLDHLRSPERFGSWFAGIARNECRRVRRERSRAPLVREDLDGGRRLPEPLDLDADPALLTENAELAARVRRAVMGLADGQREAVILFYLSDLSQAESAARLGIDVGAVKTRLHKARGTLRRRLSDGWEDNMDEKLSRRRLTTTAAALAGAAAVKHGAGAAFARTDEVAEGRSVTEQQAAVSLVDVRVTDVRRHKIEGERAGRHMVLLEEIDGDRRLPIWTGEFEAVSIAMHLERVPPIRPATYTFAGNIIQALGGRVREVRIVALVEEVFYAAVVVEGAAGTQTLDARPSDALNLALTLGTPIWVAADVFAAPVTPSRFEQAEQIDGPAEIVADVLAAR